MKAQLYFIQNLKIYIFFLIYSIIITLSLLLANCSKKSTNPEQFFYPDSNLSFNQHIHPIFYDDCSSGGNCHQSASPAAGLDLESVPLLSYNSLNRQVIFPNNADDSPLYRVLLGPFLDMDQMPYQSTSNLPGDKIKAIKTWINEGANKNN